MTLKLFQTRALSVVSSIKDYRNLRNEWYKNGLEVGFVPTMGALHNGHVSLASIARKNCDIVVASIFVNPAQFAPNEDLSKYPRTFEDDKSKFEQAGVDVIFFPSVEEIYPNGIPLEVENQVGTFVTVQGKSHQMEGRIRPTHFRGVATVVSKLFNVISPTKAYFGQKDVQQCCVIKSLVRDMLYPVEIIIAPTIREADGLAMSSRNRYLSESERRQAPALYLGMKAAVEAYERGERSRDKLLDVCKAKIIEFGVDIEYLSLAEPGFLNEIDVVESGAILSGAIRLGKTRIIDNMLIGLDSSNL